MDKIDYYLNIAEVVSQKSTCLQKHWGAIIVKDSVIVSTGYNGAPRKIASCQERGTCFRVNSPRGTDYSSCPAVHSEQNAIIFGNREDMKCATMYLVGLQSYPDGEWQYVKNPAPCSLCKRMIVNAGIKKVIVRCGKNSYKELDPSYWNIEDITGGY
jgi:dCMP deaminase